MPGTWRVPVSRQSHSRAPPGKILASLNGGWPSTSMWPQERCEIRGELGSPWRMSSTAKSLALSEKATPYCQRLKKGDVPARVHFNEEKLRCKRDRLAAQGLRSRWRHG